jgi:hypothetical protein
MWMPCAMALRNRHTLHVAHSVFALVRLSKPADLFVYTAPTLAAPCSPANGRGSRRLQMLTLFLLNAVGAGLDLAWSASHEASARAISAAGEASVIDDTLP